MCPGQRRIAGTRMPPSHTVPLWWKSGVLRDSHSPPLSLVKITIVFCRKPRLSRAREDLADALIGALEHRDVVGARAGRIVERAEVPGVVARHGRLVGQLVRPVRGVVRDVDEERPLRVLLDEPHRPLGDQVRHVAGDLHRPVVLEQVGLSVRRQVCW